MIGGLEMTKNKKTLRVSENFYNFVEKFGANRVKADMELHTQALCDLPDLIVKYFKENNDRYLELVKFGVKDGTK
jgi:hypothetical protein